MLHSDTDLSLCFLYRMRYSIHELKKHPVRPRATGKRRFPHAYWLSNPEEGKRFLRCRQLSAAAKAAAENFQRHAGLDVDGILLFRICLALHCTMDFFRTSLHYFVTG